MALIDLVSNEGRPELLAWKYPKQQLAAWTQLLVRQGEEAVLFISGKPKKSFPAGRHTLKTANLPILTKIISLPFGGRSPFMAEVWYLDMGEIPNIKWGTDTPVPVKGNSPGEIVFLSGYGQFGVRIEDAALFLATFCRNRSEFARNDLTECLRGIIMVVVKDSIALFMKHRNGVAGLEGGRMELSETICRALEPELLRYGVRLVSFYVMDISPAKGRADSSGG